MNTDLLRQGVIRCRVWCDEQLIHDFTPRSLDELWVPIEIQALGEMAQGELWMAYQQFVNSRKSRAQFTHDACKTITKFGQALRFKQTFVVEFENTQPVTRGWLRVSWADLRPLWNWLKPKQGQ